MTHMDPNARRDKRHKVNLNTYESNAVEALAMLHRQQTSTYLTGIIKAHLEALKTDRSSDQTNKSA
jgi:hypothetical protein